MLTLQRSAVTLVTVLCLSTCVIGASFNSEYNGNDIQLPTSVGELFADVYNNNSVSLQLKAREPLFVNKTIKEVSVAFFVKKLFSGLNENIWPLCLASKKNS